MVVLAYVKLGDWVRFANQCCSIFLMGLVGIVGTSCNDQPSSNEKIKDIVVEEAPPTPEEHIISVLEDEKASALVFTITPKSKFGCRSISVDLLRWSSGATYWERETEITAEYDVANPAKKTPISEQILYANLAKPGKYALANVICEPFKKDDENEAMGWRGIVGTFQSEYGRLNYIGNLNQFPLSKKVYAYGVDDQGEKLRAKLSEKSPTLSSYFQHNLIVEEKRKNFDGELVSIEEILQNKNNAADYHRVYETLRKRMSFVERKFSEISLNFHRVNWKSIGEARQKISYYGLLFEGYRETLYKFEDVSKKSNRFDLVEKYIDLRIMRDRAHAFAESCLHKDQLDSFNDECNSANSLISAADQAVEEFLSENSINVSDEKSEAEIKKKRASIRDELAFYNSLFFEKLFYLNENSDVSAVESILTVNNARYQAGIKLDLFDVNRACTRYKVHKDACQNLTDIIKKQAEAEEQAMSFAVLKLSQRDFDQDERMRRARSSSIQLWDDRVALEKTLF